MTGVYCVFTSAAAHSLTTFFRSLTARWKLPWLSYSQLLRVRSEGKSDS